MIRFKIIGDNAYLEDGSQVPVEVLLKYPHEIGQDGGVIKTGFEVGQRVALIEDGNVIRIAEILSFTIEDNELYASFTGPAGIEVLWSINKIKDADSLHEDLI